MTWIVHGRRYETRADMAARLAEIDRQFGGKRFDDATRAEWNSLNEEIDEAEREVRRARLLEMARDARNTEPGAGAVTSTTAARASTPAAAARDRALQTVETYTRSGDLSHAAADRLDAHVRRSDPLGLDARYIAAVGADAYASAFAKILSDPTHGHLRFSPEEVEAVRVVSRIEAERAPLQGSTNPTGGFALPITLDPTILLSSDGSINPIRELATVGTMATRTWQGVSSDGVTAAFQPELEEVAEGSPTLAGPEIVSRTARAFVVGSIEVFDDWVSIQAEMGRLFADAKDTLEATVFLTGTSGNDEPEGILTGLAAGQEVTTAGSGAMTLADLYSLKQAVPDRWKGRSTFVAHSDTVDRIWQFVAVADQSEARAMENRSGDLLGRPVAEWNTMSTSIVAGEKVLLAGDMSAFRIMDRLGSRIELVPHILGAANRLPVGGRGLFFYWRVGAAVTVPNAIRVLKIKA